MAEWVDCDCDTDADGESWKVMDVAGDPSEVSPEGLVGVSRRLRARVGALHFGGRVAYVYSPLDYAREPHEEYLRRFGTRRGVALLLGMNPGPWGMAQTGVPFGEVSLVRDWMKIDGRVGRPAREHPKRPITGFSCHRSEVSGARLWGWARERFGSPDAFFKRFFVWNFCPLSFLTESGANLTPDKLSAAERAELYAACGQALAEGVGILQPRAVIGIGKFAEERAREVLADGEIPLGCILHPSPANPLANGGWAKVAEGQLRELGAL